MLCHGDPEKPLAPTPELQVEKSVQLSSAVEPSNLHFMTAGFPVVEYHSGLLANPLFSRVVLEY